MEHQEEATSSNIIYIVVIILGYLTSGFRVQILLGKIFSFYSLFQKKRTFNSKFFCGPPGGLGTKIHIVDYVNGSSNGEYFIA